MGSDALVLRTYDTLACTSSVWAESSILVNASKLCPQKVQRLAFHTILPQHHVFDDECVPWCSWTPRAVPLNSRVLVEGVPQMPQMLRMSALCCSHQVETTPTFKDMSKALASSCTPPMVAGCCILIDGRLRVEKRLARLIDDPGAMTVCLGLNRRALGRDALQRPDDGGRVGTLSLSIGSRDRREGDGRRNRVVRNSPRASLAEGRVCYLVCGESPRTTIPDTTRELP